MFRYESDCLQELQSVNKDSHSLPFLSLLSSQTVPQLVETFESVISHKGYTDTHLHSFSDSFGIHHLYAVLKRSLNAGQVSVHYFIYTAGINYQFKLGNVS